MKEKLFFDNNAIDFVQENQKMFFELKNHFDYYISPTALEELANIKDDYKERRIKNLICLIEMSPHFLYDSVFIFDYSRWNCACLGNGDVYKQILNPSKNNIRDAIIADTAVVNNCILLTNDKQLYNKMHNLGYACFNLADITDYYSKL